MESLEQVLKAVSDSVPMPTGVVRKLCDLRGKRVTSVDDLLPMLVYIACGPEPCVPLGRCAYAMPDDDAFLKTLPPDAKTAVSPQATVVVQRSRRRAAERGRGSETPPRTVWVYRNADEHDEPHRVSVNTRLYPSMRRLFESLDRTTRLVEGKVTSLVEVTTGREVASMAEIKDGFRYAACGGSVPFRMVDYREPPTRSEVLRPADEHAMLSTEEFGSSARRNAAAAPKARNILVFVNGSTSHLGELVAVHRRSYRTLVALLAFLSSRLGLVSGVRRLVTLGGAAEITRIEDVADGGMYVACGTEKYRDVAYPLPEDDPFAGAAAGAGAGSDDNDVFAYMDGDLSPGATVVVVPERIAKRKPEHTWTKH